METIWRVVICHSGASFFLSLFFFVPFPHGHDTLLLLLATGNPDVFVLFCFGSMADLGSHIIDHRSSSLSLSVRRCCCALFLGLDGIDHLGLGGALWGTWTVFRYGIHTWHHCRYVIIILTSPLPLRCVMVVSFFMTCIGSGLYALAFGIIGLLPSPRVARR